MDIGLPKWALLALAAVAATTSEIEGIWLGREFYPIEKAKTVAKTVFETANRQLRSTSAVDEGNYLYRAPDQKEWTNILKDGYYTVLMQTNFEKEIGPQVRLYANEKGYAGMIIRIAVPGPYYAHAGMQVPRVTSILPHYASVEVLEENQWISLEAYKARHPH